MFPSNMKYSQGNDKPTILKVSERVEIKCYRHRNKVKWLSLKEKKLHSGREKKHVKLNQAVLLLPKDK